MTDLLQYSEYGFNIQYSHITYQYINTLCKNAMLGRAEWAERILIALFTSFALDEGKKR
jgi:hypothetical protein